MWMIAGEISWFEDALLLLLLLSAADFHPFQAKYKDAAKKEASSCEYHQLPETLETQHAKEASQMQSEVPQTHSLHYFYHCALNLKRLQP